MNESRINMRISKDNHERIKDASKRVGQDLTSFITEAALDRADQVTSERNIFKLTAEEIATLERALAEEPKFIPALHDLLQEGRKSKP